MASHPRFPKSRAETRPLERDLAAQSFSRGQNKRRSLEAEQSLLGALLIEPDAFPQVRGLLRTSDFGFKLNAQIWTALVELDDHGKKVDFFHVTESLREAGTLAEVGGADYLTSLMEACHNAALVGEFARVVLQNAVLSDTAQGLQITAGQMEFFPDSSTRSDLVNGLGLIERAEAQIKSAKDRLVYAVAAGKSVDDSILDELYGEQEWLWENWIPRGEVTLLGGRPGVGKSQIALDLFARLIRAKRGEEATWPDGTPIGFDVPRDQQFLWVDTENAMRLFKQRRNAWGLGTGHFRLHEPEQGRFRRDFPLLRVDDDAKWSWIYRAVRETRTPLMVLDSLAQAHNGEENSNDYMKGIMSRLTELASEFNMALVVIHHLNKLPAGFPEWPPTQDMFRGASAIIQFPRSVLACGRPSVTEKECGLMCVKNNLAAIPDPLGFTPTGEGPAWGDAPAVGSLGSELDAREKAAGFLLEYLANGPRWATDVEKEAEAQGIAKRTLDRAKGNLVRSYRTMNRWAWELSNKNWEKPGANQFLPGETL